MAIADNDDGTNGSTTSGYQLLARERNTPFSRLLQVPLESAEQPSRQLRPAVRQRGDQC